MPRAITCVEAMRHVLDRTRNPSGRVSGSNPFEARVRTRDVPLGTWRRIESGSGREDGTGVRGKGWNTSNGSIEDERVRSGRKRGVLATTREKKGRMFDKVKGYTSARRGRCGRPALHETEDEVEAGDVSTMWEMHVSLDVGKVTPNARKDRLPKFLNVESERSACR